MTRRQDIERQRHGLGEVRGIMNSMKTLAYLETRKLSRFVEAQQAVSASIEEVAADFLAFHADSLPVVGETTAVYLLIGTERGFCGDFNHGLLHQLESSLQTTTVDSPILITVGHKLNSIVENDERVLARLEGASVVEEVTSVLTRIVDQLSLLQQQYGMLSLYALHHRADQDIVIDKLLPPFQHDLQQATQHSHPPLLNLSSEQFLLELTEHHLFAALMAILYASLMAENYHRVSHLQGVIKHLDDETDELLRLDNSLRQEEIIEEIEVILLSAGNLDQSYQEKKPGHPPAGKPGKGGG